MSEQGNISFCVPSRARPIQMLSMFDSAIQTATQPNKLSAMFYLDDDDELGQMGLNKLKRKYGGQVDAIVGPRICLSETHTAAYFANPTEYAGVLGDDVLFRTNGWDDAVRESLGQTVDKIGIVGFDDKYNYDNLTHFWVHENWVKVLGYLTRPGYQSDFSDTDCNDIAKSIGRRYWRMDYVVEHMHFAANKGIIDITMREKLERLNTQRTQLVYNQMHQARLADIQKLQKFINERTA